MDSRLLYYHSEAVKLLKVISVSCHDILVWNKNWNKDWCYYGDIIAGVPSDDFVRRSDM